MNVNWKLEPPSLANVNRKARSETEILIEEETKGETEKGIKEGNIRRDENSDRN